MQADPQPTTADHRLAIDRAHRRYCAALDPLLPMAGPVLPGDGDQMLSVTVGESAGYARARFVESDPDSVGALWGPLRQHGLTYRLSGDDRAGVLRSLLADWLGGTVGPAGDWESAAVVTVPSRDPECRNPLLEFGFAPVIVVAARRRPNADPSGPPAGRVRVATERDLSALTEMAVQLHEYDVASGMLTRRPSRARLLRDMLSEQLQTWPGWTWLAEIDGRAVGFGYVQPPAAAEWIAGLVPAGTSPAYLAEMFVGPSVRSTGIGALLTAAAHRKLDQAGVPLTLLHHALPNPYSTPFWARMGYRPVWTTWQRRPLSGPPR